MRQVDGWGLLPSKPDVRWWFGSIVLGLMGFYLITGTLAAETGSVVEGTLLPLGVFATTLGFLQAYSTARDLDDAEVDR